MPSGNSTKNVPQYKNKIYGERGAKSNIQGPFGARSRRPHTREKHHEREGYTKYRRGRRAKDPDAVRCGPEKSNGVMYFGVPLDSACPGERKENQRQTQSRHRDLRVSTISPPCVVANYTTRAENRQITHTTLRYPQRLECCPFDSSHDFPRADDAPAPAPAADPTAAKNSRACWRARGHLGRQQQAPTNRHAPS